MSAILSAVALPGQPQMKVVDVTPALAREWLARNLGNRPITPAVVNRYARDMSEGRWKMAGDPIRFSKTGKLIDGQHRLTAILKTGVTVACVIVTDLDDSIFNVIDTGRTRSKSVVAQAVPELVEAMDDGRVSVSAAAAIAELPKAEQAAIAKQDSKAMKAAAKKAKEKKRDAIPEVKPAAPPHVLQVINGMDVLIRYAQGAGLTIEGLEQAFLADVDPEHPVIADRLRATLPVMAALGRIADEMATRTEA